MYSYYDKKRRRKKTPSRLWQPGDQFKVEFEWQIVEKKYNFVMMLRVLIKSLIMSAAYYQYLPTAPVWF